MSFVTVYHGTAMESAREIEQHGLTSNMGYDSPDWYMVAADFASAAFHAKGHTGGRSGETAVVEFRVPTETRTTLEGRPRPAWPGYPYLWKGREMDWHGQPTAWYALRKPLPASLVVRVHELGRGGGKRRHSKKRSVLALATDVRRSLR